MACLRIVTNLSTKEITSDFWHQFLPMISSSVKLPAKSLICAITPDSHLNIEGEISDPAVVASLETTSWHAQELNYQSVVDDLGKFFGTKYDVPKKRIFMTFQNFQPQKSNLQGTPTTPVLDADPSISEPPIKTKDH